jgi:RNA-directed DNA polymerase
MPQEAPPNGSAPGPAPGPWSRVAEMQAKLHRWAAADPGRRFDDLFNFAHDPATLIVAFGRVAGNRGANTPGVDGLRVAGVEEAIGVPGSLDGLRTSLKDGSFRPLPVRERKIPKPGGSGKVRKLGIPTIADRVVQAALKLVLEPIFEADFCLSLTGSGRCGGRTTLSPRSSGSAPRVTSGCWTLTSRRALTPSRTRP